MDINNVERNLRSLRRLYSLLQSKANNEYVPKIFSRDENTHCLLKILPDYATNEILARQSKIIAYIPYSNVPDTFAIVASQKSVTPTLGGTRINTAFALVRERVHRWAVDRKPWRDLDQGRSRGY